MFKGRIFKQEIARQREHIGANATRKKNVMNWVNMVIDFSLSGLMFGTREIWTTMHVVPKNLSTSWKMLRAERSPISALMRKPPLMASGGDGRMLAMATSLHAFLHGSATGRCHQLEMRQLVAEDYNLVPIGGPLSAPPPTQPILMGTGFLKPPFPLPGSLQLESSTLFLPLCNDISLSHLSPSAFCHCWAPLGVVTLVHLFWHA